MAFKTVQNYRSTSDSSYMSCLFRVCTVSHTSLYLLLKKLKTGHIYDKDVYNCVLVSIDFNHYLQKQINKIKSSVWMPHCQCLTMTLVTDYCLIVFVICVLCCDDCVASDCIDVWHTLRSFYPLYPITAEHEMNLAHS